MTDNNDEGRPNANGGDGEGFDFKAWVNGKKQNAKRPHSLVQRLNDRGHGDLLRQPANSDSDAAAAVAQFDEWFNGKPAERPAITRPAQPINLPAGGDPYANKALELECAELAAMAPNTGRNHKLNRAKFNLARFINSGHLTNTEVDQALTSAARASGLPDSEIEYCLRGDRHQQAAAAKMGDRPAVPPREEIPAAHVLDETGDSDAPDLDPAAAAKAGQAIRRATDLQASSAPKWLAQKRIPRGQVTVLVGDEGIGKSLFWVWLVTYITTGRPRPEYGILARDPGVVLLILTEDEWGTAVRPRLEAAGANLDNVRVMADGHGDAPVFPQDFPLIQTWPEPLEMIVVDAWLDTVSGALKVADTQQARQALHPWKQVSATTGAAVLLITHTNRVASGSARDRMGGTAALRQKARMVLLAQLDEDDQLTIGPEKSNGARLVDAATFDIAAVQHFEQTDDHDGLVPVLTYDGDAGRTARQIHADVFAAQKEAAKRKGGEPDDEVSLWLRDTIRGAADNDPDGRCWAAPTYDAAEALGWSDKKLRIAKEKLGVRAIRDHVAGRWYWVLPTEGAAE